MIGRIAILWLLLAGVAGAQCINCGGGGGGGGGSGTVTSITGGTGLNGGTITTSGTISLATPVAAANGGNADTVGRLNKTVPNITLNEGANAACLGVGNPNPCCNSATPGSGVCAPPVTNALVNYDWIGWPANAAVWAELQGNSVAGKTVALGVCTGTCDSNTAHAATVVHQGPATCIFDGNATIGNIATPSTSVDGDCHDSGTAQGGQIATQTLGIIATANAGGAGGTATVNFNINAPIPVGFATKVIVGSSRSCGIDSWATVNGGGSGTSFVGLPIDGGFQNAEFRNVGGNVDITFGASMPTLLAFRLAVTSNGTGAQTQTDPHGFSPSALLSFAPNTRYGGLVWTAPFVSFFQGSISSINPLRVGGTISLQCQQHGGTAVTVNTSTSDSYGDGHSYADGGTQMQVDGSALMGVF